MTAQQWGMLLVVVAVLAIGLHAWRWRTGRVRGGRAVGDLVARLGFLFLGIVYAADLVRDWRRGPLFGLAVVGLGIVINLAAGIIDNVRRSRRPPEVEE